MNGLLNSPEVFLYREAVDFRKSINGLSSLIVSDVSLPLSSGALFLFVNRQRDKIKILQIEKKRGAKRAYLAVIGVNEGLNNC